MISFFLKTSRTRLLTMTGLLIILIALLDWYVDLNVSFGFLYLFPMLMAGICLRRWQLVVVAGLCTLFAEWFDPFAWSAVAGIFRVLFTFAAYLGMGFFACEFSKNRRLTLQHIKDIEQEIELRCIFEGLSNKEIGVRLGISESSVKAVL
jgi:hypothetical protein